MFAPVPSIWLMCQLIRITERHEPDTQLSGIYSNLFHYERIYKQSSRRVFFWQIISAVQVDK